MAGVYQLAPRWSRPICNNPLLQDDVARWLATDDELGTPFRHLQRLSKRGFEVKLIMPGSLDAARSWLKQDIPPIILVSTGE